MLASHYLLSLAARPDASGSDGLLPAKFPHFNPLAPRYPSLRDAIPLVLKLKGLALCILGRGAFITSSIEHLGASSSILEHLQASSSISKHYRRIIQNRQNPTSIQHCPQCLHSLSESATCPSTFPPRCTLRNSTTVSMPS